MSEYICNICKDEKVLNYYGECCICADCSDDLKMYDYIQALKAQLAEAEKVIDSYLFDYNVCDGFDGMDLYDHVKRAREYQQKYVTKRTQNS